MLLQSRKPKTHTTGAGDINEYQKIAADYDLDGRVTSLDALYILQHSIDSNTTAPDPQWRFVDSANSTILSNDGMMVTPDSGDIELIGVLTGDVDGSWADA